MFLWKRLEWPFENYQIKYHGYQADDDDYEDDHSISDIKGTFLVALTIIKFKTIKVYMAAEA